jgi:hypothetical protein
MSSENPSGAGNQQERPGIEQWIVGFVDGEGCFSIPIYRNPTYKIGWQVQPRFAIVQGARSVYALKLIRAYFGCGSLYLNRRHDNHREDLFVYGVFRFEHLRHRIVPFFEEHPLITAKADEFAKFAVILRMMEKKLHLTMEGLTTIAEIAQTMNHRKPSRFLESSEAIRQPALSR